MRKVLMNRYEIEGLRKEYKRGQAVVTAVDYVSG